MKRTLILTVMLVSVLVLGFAQTTLSGTYRYGTNYYITFTGSNFTGSYGSSTAISGTYSVSGSRLTLNRANGTTWNWTIVDANTIRDHDGDNWVKEGGSTQSAAPTQTQSGASYYVSARGNDINDGLSEATPFRSLGSAFLRASSSSDIKRITVIGTLDKNSEGSGTYAVFNLMPLSSEEIVITGKPGATGSERAVLSGRGSGVLVLRTVMTSGSIRFENIEISGGEGENGCGILISDGSTITLGPGAVVRSNQVCGIFVNEGTCVIDGGEVRENTGIGGGIAVNEKGILTMRSGSIRDNGSPTAIAGGVSVTRGGRFTMSGGTITGNRATEVGGGVVVLSGGRFDQTGGTISNNTAGQGSNPNVYREQGALGSNLTPGTSGPSSSGSSGTTLSGTYRYGTNFYITFSGSNFTGSYGSSTALSGTYSVSGSRLTLNRANGTTWNWTIVDANTLKDQDGDSWVKGSSSSSSGSSGSSGSSSSGSLGTSGGSSGSSSSSSGSSSSSSSSGGFDWHIPVFLGAYAQVFNLNLMSIGVPLQAGVEMDIGQFLSLALLGEASAGVGLPYTLEFGFGGMAEVYLLNKTLGFGIGFGSQSVLLLSPEVKSYTNAVALPSDASSGYTRFSLIFRKGGGKFSIFAQFYSKPIYGNLQITNSTGTTGSSGTIDFNNIPKLTIGISWTGNLRNGL